MEQKFGRINQLSDEISPSLFLKLQLATVNSMLTRNLYVKLSASF